MQKHKLFTRECRQGIVLGRFKRGIVFIFCLSLVSNLYGCLEPKMSVSMYQPINESEREVLEAVRQLVRGVNEKILEEIMKLYTPNADVDNFVYNFRNPFGFYTYLGKKVTKEQLAQNYRDNFDPSKFSAATLDIVDPQIQIKDDKAVLQGQAIIDHTTVNGARDVYIPYIALVFQRMGPQWKIIKERYSYMQSKIRKIKVD